MLCGAASADRVVLSCPRGSLTERTGARRHRCPLDAGACRRLRVSAARGPGHSVPDRLGRGGLGLYLLARAEHPGPQRGLVPLAAAPVSPRGLGAPPRPHGAVARVTGDDLYARQTRATHRSLERPAASPCPPKTSSSWRCTSERWRSGTRRNPTRRARVATSGGGRVADARTLWTRKSSTTAMVISCCALPTREAVELQ